LKFLIFILLLVFIAVAALAFLKRRRDMGVQWPFYAKQMLTKPEQILYHRIVSSLPEHIVLAQVQVSRVLGVKKGFNFHEWNNKINRLSYDFVVCTKDFTVLAAIELDDKSHENPSRVDAESKKDRATNSAGIRMIRWNVKSLPDEAAIQAQFPTDSAIERTRR